MMKAILVDTTKCQGCEQCVSACTQVNGLPPEIPEPKLREDGLSSRRVSSVVRLPRGGFAKKQCLHCLSPGCVTVCPVGAMQKTAAGPVIYDRDKCMGCRYCMLGCPVGIPRYEWDKTLPYAVKCDMCYPRLERGEAPACVQACKYGVLQFGERDALLSEAHGRLAQGRARYVQHVFGERELGGTSVMYLANQPLDVLGWPDQMGDRALASFTWPLISKTPWMALGVASFLVGTQFIIQRRMRLGAEAAGPAEDSSTKSEQGASAEGAPEATPGAADESAGKGEVQ